jgi:hypothetical protein
VTPGLEGRCSIQLSYGRPHGTINSVMGVWRVPMFHCGQVTGLATRLSKRFIDSRSPAILALKYGPV